MLHTELSDPLLLGPSVATPAPLLTYQTLSVNQAFGRLRGEAPQLFRVTAAMLGCHVELQGGAWRLAKLS